MATSFEWGPCINCPHKVVPGVACDGRYELCHLMTCDHRPDTRSDPEEHDYVYSVAWLAQRGEFDAVRSEI